MYTVIESPIGDLLLTCERDVLTGLYFSDRHGDPSSGDYGERQDDHPVLELTRAQLGEYFTGNRREFTMALEPRGNPFELRVWDALLQIPYGKTWSYGQLAARIGAPKAAQAVGAANGRNPVSIIIPCHRVIGADGNLVGYGGGLDRKRTLLVLEEPLPDAAGRLF